MLCVAICEDDIYARLDILKKTRTYFEQIAVDYSVADFASGEELLASGLAFDIAIMDIQMKGMNGLEASREMQRRNAGMKFIFLTSFPDYVFDSFDVNVTSYLLKPVSEDKIAAALGKIVSKADERDYVLVKGGSACSKVYCQDIFFCESIGHKISIATKTGRIEFYGSMDSFCDGLGDNFCRIHRAFVVNLDYVDKRHGDIVVMANGETLPLARRKQSGFMSSLLAHLGKGL